MILSVLSALVEPTRLEVMRLLRDGSENCACELTRVLGATQSRMSRHMQVLQRAELAFDRCDAQRVRYRVDPDLPSNFRALLDAALTEELRA